MVREGDRLNTFLPPRTGRTDGRLDGRRSPSASRQQFFPVYLLRSGCILRMLPSFHPLCSPLKDKGNVMFPTKKTFSIHLLSASHPAELCWYQKSPRWRTGESSQPCDPSRQPSHLSGSLSLTVPECGLTSCLSGAHGGQQTRYPLTTWLEGLCILSE